MSSIERDCMREYNAPMRGLSYGKAIYIISLITLILFLNSCLTINSKMKINSNGSGSITIKYSMDSSLNGISSLGSDDDIVPLNLSEEYIVQIIGLRNDIVYKNYRITEDGNYYIVEVTFLFDNIDALNSILPKENAIILERNGNNTIFKQGIVSSTDEEIHSESLDILKDIYKDHSFTFEVKVPSDIIEVDHGEKIGSRIALYKENFLDVITSPDKKEWSIRW